jgi:hypothetical protein
MRKLSYTFKIRHLLIGLALGMFLASLNWKDGARQASADRVYMAMDRECAKHTNGLGELRIGLQKPADKWSGPSYEVWYCTKHSALGGFIILRPIFQVFEGNDGLLQVEFHP